MEASTLLCQPGRLVSLSHFFDAPSGRVKTFVARLPKNIAGSRGAASTVEGCNVLMINQLAEVKKVRVGYSLLDESNGCPASRSIREYEILSNESVRP